jgi:hypothetical protein
MLDVMQLNRCRRIIGTNEAGTAVVCCLPIVLPGPVGHANHLRGQPFSLAVPPASVDDGDMVFAGEGAQPRSQLRRSRRP